MACGSCPTTTSPDPTLGGGKTVGNEAEIVEGDLGDIDACKITGGGDTGVREIGGNASQRLRGLKVTET